MPVIRPLKTLAAVRPNCGFEKKYKRLIACLIEQMHDSIRYWLSASFKANEPEMAQDAIPAVELRKTMRKLRTRWMKRFNEASLDLADYFAEEVSKRTDAQLKKILKDAGITVKWTMTKAMRDVLKATVQQNVTLIRSIPQQYLHQVEGAVMRSVQTGRDLHQLTKDIQGIYNVTYNRAAFIALDQNNKATAALTRTRQVELGIEKAVWVHSGAGKHPRPSHVKAGKNKVTFDLKTGWFDPHEQKYILPGELINCRCVHRPVIAGFTV